MLQLLRKMKKKNVKKIIQLGIPDTQGTFSEKVTPRY